MIKDLSKGQKFYNWISVQTSVKSFILDREADRINWIAGLFLSRLGGQRGKVKLPQSKWLDGLSYKE